MNSPSKPDYSLSQFYTDNDIKAYPKLLLITKIHKETFKLYGKIYPPNDEAKKYDKLLVAIFNRMIDNLGDKIKCNVTYDKCYDALITMKTTAIQTNSIYINFANIVEHWIGRTKTLDCPHYQKALKELQSMGYLKDKS